MMLISMSLRKVALLTIVFLLAVGVYRYSRPIPGVTAVASLAVPKANPAVDLPWPAYGQGALAAQGYGVLQTHGQQKSVPMASIAKVVTALAVLKQKPLAIGEQGPTITINSDDVAIYNNYYSQGGSVVKVEIGEQISEYQALQALLIPSANNIADTLVHWAFGSNENYLSYANKMVADMNLGSTKVADASGFSPQSVSSAEDLARLGLAAMDNPVLASVVGQQTALLPIAGTVNNVNWLLDSDGVVGIKTGNTAEAGGCFLFAAKRMVNGQSLTLVGALMQAPDLNTVIKDSRAIIVASDSGFESVKVATKGQVVGSYKTPWSTSGDVIASQDLSILAWRGSQLQVVAKLNKIKPPVLAGGVVGSVSVTSDQKTNIVPVTLKTNLPSPSWTWRIFR
ncbi:MAG: hypothetical protein Q7R60_00295 [bacterium]|nr:hypothetical protein [bacterium]